MKPIKEIVPEVLEIVELLQENPRLCCKCEVPITSKNDAGGSKTEAWCWDCVKKLDGEKLDREVANGHA